MKKLLIITSLLVVSYLLNAQTYVSNFQIDMALSGNKKAMNEKATLVFSKEKGEFSVKFNGLQTTEKFKISFLDKVEGESPYTVYTIENNINFAALKVAKFSEPVEGNDGSIYSTCFTLIGINRKGDIAYYTAFYVK